MASKLQLEMLPQPDDSTCGPTCLHAVYRYFGDHLPLDDLIRETPQLDEGGTLAVLLGSHALRRGYRATIYTYNLTVLDPTWFRPDAPPLAQRLEAQMAAKDSPKLHAASRAYREFLDLGGELRMEDLSARLIRRYLEAAIPILTGLSATYLYRCARERGVVPDDVGGESAGHFVVLCGLDKKQGTVEVADPYLPNPLGEHYYQVTLDRVIGAILLGVLSYDANLLIVQPGAQVKG